MSKNKDNSPKPLRLSTIAVLSKLVQILNFFYYWELNRKIFYSLVYRKDLKMFSYMYQCSLLHIDESNHLKPQYVNDVSNCLELLFFLWQNYYLNFISQRNKLHEDFINYLKHLNKVIKMSIISRHLYHKFFSNHYSSRKFSYRQICIHFLLI